MLIIFIFLILTLVVFLWSSLRVASLCDKEEEIEVVKKE